ncbi:MAG: NTP transferase domain-containing protein, partial [Alphaproteobacteria bacterium]|nr:NTP transferase domain-containing protein [Alphaproteobacteria bacterium]
MRDFVHFAAHRRSQLAVVMAGGFGTRLRPLTADAPKPLLCVAGRPVLFILLDQVLNEGFEKVYLTLHYRAEDIIAMVRSVPRYRDRVEFVVEREPLGTAGSLACLPQRPSEPFLLMNADLLTEVPLRHMLGHHEREGNAVTVATKLETYQIPFGVFDMDGSRIVAVREKPSYSMVVNTGIYVVGPSALDAIEPGAALDMTDLLTRLMNDGQRIGSFPVHEYWLDIGTHEQY